MSFFLETWKKMGLENINDAQLEAYHTQHSKENLKQYDNRRQLVGEEQQRRGLIEKHVKTKHHNVPPAF